VTVRDSTNKPSQDAMSMNTTFTDTCSDQMSCTCGVMAVISSLSSSMSASGCKFSILSIAALAVIFGQEQDTLNM
jgi:hypothetical protein